MSLPGTVPLIGRLLKLSAALVLCLPPAPAASLSTSVSAAYAPEEGQLPWPTPEYCSDSGEGFAGCATSESWASAWASYGSVVIGGLAQGTGSFGQSYAFADASFSDEITILGPYTSGFISFYFDVWCTFDMYGAACVGLSGGSFNIHGRQWGFEPNTPRPFEFGQPIPLMATAHGDTYKYQTRGTAFEAHAILLSILITDASGEPLPGIRFGGSASGASYVIDERNLVPLDDPPIDDPPMDDPPVTIPEPGTALVVAAALIMLLARRNPRRTSRTPR